MKKIFRALTLCLVLLSLLCAAVPAAFAAGNKEDAFYTIGLDACGGVSSTVVVTTNLDGKLTTLPESPTMDGYTFNGWYTEPVGGSRITTATVFTGDTTVYAHCLSLVVHAGQTVKQGQLIGYVGSTGRSSGNHCHFEIRRNGSYIAPQNVFNRRKYR